MVDKIRPLSQIITPIHVMEGAGVLLKRSIATRTLDYYDPFLLLDHFGSEDPADYLAGFPMHPHRGIETVTYMLAGHVDHHDSLGNHGSIGAGDVQWMTAGRGIMHEEMPKPIDGKMEGFQLWVNLPARLKMTAPRYQGFSSKDIPEKMLPSGIKIRLIAGHMGDVSGAVTDIFADPTYLDIAMPPETTFIHPVAAGQNAFIYIFRGEASIGENNEKVTAPRLVLLGDGDQVAVETESKEAHFLLVSGLPLGEPIARYGPFVMNTRAEIEQTLKELREGTFIKGSD